LNNQQDFILQNSTGCQVVSKTEKEVASEEIHGFSRGPPAKAGHSEGKELGFQTSKILSCKTVRVVKIHGEIIVVGVFK